MTRALRIEIADAVYHVTSRGLERREIVRGDADRAKWLELLDTLATRVAQQRKRPGPRAAPASATGSTTKPEA